MLTKGKSQPRSGRSASNKTAAATLQGEGLGVRLDGRSLKTPQGRPLVLPTQAAAELLPEEWAAQGPNIVVADMPAAMLALDDHAMEV